MASLRRSGNKSMAIAHSAGDTAKRVQGWQFRDE
jgi:hypothetical protein